ncbi:hypothetical protein Tco_0256007 [Tanacetum coccineum]
MGVPSKRTTGHGLLVGPERRQTLIPRGVVGASTVLVGSWCVRYGVIVLASFFCHARDVVTRWDDGEAGWVGKNDDEGVMVEVEG